MIINQSYKTIIFEIEDRIARITLNRPDVHNAFNGNLISDLFTAFEFLKTDKEVRAIVLTGNGKSFCAGADLNWMKSVVNYTYHQNYQESLQLAHLMLSIYTHPKPVIARVNGSAIGGGVGLMSVCDIAVTSDEAKFALSEVRLGLAPAVISPFVINRIGRSNARELFITGERISAARAAQIGLVNSCVKPNQLDEEVNSKLEMILSSSPNAIRTIKEMLFKINQTSFPELSEYTAELIADLRLSKDGQEGMNSFLEKRKPYWAEK